MSRWSHSLSCRRCRCRGRCHCRCHCCDCLHCPVVVVFVFILVAVAVVAIVDHQYKLKIIFAQKQITFLKTGKSGQSGKTLVPQFFSVPQPSSLKSHGLNIFEMRRKMSETFGPTTIHSVFLWKFQTKMNFQTVVKNWSHIGPLVLWSRLMLPALLSLELTALTSEQW